MSAPYSVKLDASSARDLATKGAALLVLDVPPGTAVGIDQHTFVVGPKFRGVKMVPPGPHVLSYAAGGGPGGFSPTTAVFTHAAAGQVLAWRWNAAEELLMPIADDSQLAALHQAVYSFQLDDGLAPYNLPVYSVWRALSLHISPAVIARVAPVGGNISAVSEGQEASVPGRGCSTSAEQALEAQLGQGRTAAAGMADQPRVQQGEAGSEAASSLQLGIEGGQGCGSHTTVPADGDASQAAAVQTAAPGIPSSRQPAAHAGRCFFTPLPLLIKRSGLQPSELTAANLDKSGALEQLLAQRFKGRQEEFLGEFQFAFLAFLLGHSMDGFGQWRSYVQLMFGCYDAAVGSCSTLFEYFLRALHAQLAHSLEPVGDQDTTAGFMDEVMQDSFLHQWTSRWLRWLRTQSGQVPTTLIQAGQQLEGLLEGALGWGGSELLEHEDGDGPVVVDGLELLNIG